MFNLFRPTCPCDPAAKAWVEERLQWLVEEFDDTTFHGRQVVRPTPEFFPDPYDGSMKAVRTLFDRVCGYMDVVPALVALKFVNEAGQQPANVTSQREPDYQPAGTARQHHRRNKHDQRPPGGDCDDLKIQPVPKMPKSSSTTWIST